MFISLIYQCGFRFRVVFEKGLQSAKIGAIYSSGVFHFNSIKTEFSIQDEINFTAAPRVPIGQLISAFGVINPGTQMLGNETFQTGITYLRIRIESPSA